MNILTLKGKSGKSIILNAVIEKYKTLVIHHSPNPLLPSGFGEGAYYLDIDFDDFDLQEIINGLHYHKFQLIIFYVNCQEDEVIRYKQYAEQLRGQVGLVIITVQE